MTERVPTTLPRPYTCTKCSKSFSWKHVLKRHVKFCGRKKSFACRSCTKLFQCSSDLQVHELNVCGYAVPDAEVLDADGDDRQQCDDHGASADDVGSAADVQLKRGSEGPSDVDAAQSDILPTPDPTFVLADRAPIQLDPRSAATFVSHDKVLMNKMIHSTSPEACVDILRMRQLKPSIPKDEKYDGFPSSSASSSLRARTHFELRRASDGMLFPFSQYPKRLPANSAIKILMLDARMLLEPENVVFYVATTPTEFGLRYSTVYHSHVIVTKRGSREEQFARNSHFKELDMLDNRILLFSNDDEKDAQIATTVCIDGIAYSHSVVLGFLGGLAFGKDTVVDVEDGVKISFSDEKVKCPVNGCSISCKGIANLKAHYRPVHAGLKSFTCQDCDKKFGTQFSLTRHLRTAHCSDEEATLCCRYCASQFQQKRDLIKHIVSSHRQDVLHKCAQCDKTFSVASALKAHVSSVHCTTKMFQCALCLKNFAEKGSLKRHVSTVHNKEKRHKCSIGSCDKAFFGKSDLERHVKAVHSQDKHHQCTLCQRTFALKGNLKRHVAVVHVRSAAHGCSQCDKTFSSSSYLKRHVAAVHSREKPHSCSVCNKSFAEKGNLKKHIAKVHK